MKPSVIWTYEMYQRVLDEYPSKGTALAKELGVTKSALIDKAGKLGVSYNNPFTTEEEQNLVRHGRKLKEAAMFLMPDRSAAEVHAALCALHYA